jgi:hypothetical protein
MSAKSTKKKQEMRDRIVEIILDNVVVSGKFFTQDWKEKYFLAGEGLAAEKIMGLFEKERGKKFF